jgi:hypothetical protein
MHYVRDVTFEEDASRIRSANAPRIMASFSNLVISLFRLIGIDSIPKVLRQFAAKPRMAVRLIGL